MQILLEDKNVVSMKITLLLSIDKTSSAKVKKALIVNINSVNKMLR